MLLSPSFEPVSPSSKCQLSLKEGRIVSVRSDRAPSYDPQEKERASERERERKQMAIDGEGDEIQHGTWFGRTKRREMCSLQVDTPQVSG